jgi:hypothetical protein
MKIFVSGAIVAFGLALAHPAYAEPGQCSFTGFDEFACDVAADGGGITFALPDGQTLVFVHSGDGAGQAFLNGAGVAPGSLPRALGEFLPAESRPGCWIGQRDGAEFCASIAQ